MSSCLTPSPSQSLDTTVPLKVDLDMLVLPAEKFPICLSDHSHTCLAPNYGHSSLPFLRSIFSACLVVQVVSHQWSYTDLNNPTFPGCKPWNHLGTCMDLLWLLAFWCPHAWIHTHRHTGTHGTDSSLERKIDSNGIQ